MRWIAGKALAALLTLAFVLVFNFFLFRIMGDPTAQLARLPRGRRGGDRRSCAPTTGSTSRSSGQFADYAQDTVKLDLGVSQRSRRDVADELREAIPWTVLLVGTGTLIATVLGTWLGVIAATRRGTAADDGLLGFSLFTYAAPEYWIGIILILLFAVAIPIFPAGQQVTPGAEFSSFFARGGGRGRAHGAAGDRAHADAARASTS